MIISQTAITALLSTGWPDTANNVSTTARGEPANRSIGQFDVIINHQDTLYNEDRDDIHKSIKLSLSILYVSLSSLDWLWLQKNLLFLLLLINILITNKATLPPGATPTHPHPTHDHLHHHHPPPQVPHPSDKAWRLGLLLSLSQRSSALPFY